MSEEIFCPFCSAMLAPAGDNIPFHYRVWPTETALGSGIYTDVSEMCFGSDNPIPKDPPFDDNGMTKFDEEEQKLLRNWVQNRIKSQEIMDKYPKGEVDTLDSLQKFSQMLHELEDSLPRTCPHDREFLHTCLTCDDLQEKINLLFGYPEDDIDEN